MSQKIAKLWGLSALATKLLFRQIYCHHQPFTSVDGFLKRLTKNKSLKFEVEFFGNVGALSPTRETEVDDKKTVLWCFYSGFVRWRRKAFNASGQFTEDSFWIVAKVVDAVN